MNTGRFLKGAALVLSALVSVNIHAYSTLDRHSILQDSVVRQCAYCALKKAGFGRMGLAEQAFWVLETPQGRDCDFWDTRRSTETSAVTDTLPANAVALFHTHADNAVVINAHDRETARQLEQKYGQGIVFYILAGRKLGEIDPVTQTETSGKELGNNSDWIRQLTPEQKKDPCPS